METTFLEVGEEGKWMAADIKQDRISIFFIFDKRTLEHCKTKNLKVLYTPKLGETNDVINMMNRNSLENLRKNRTQKKPQKYTKFNKKLENSLRKKNSVPCERLLKE